MAAPAHNLTTARRSNSSVTTIHSSSAKDESLITLTTDEPKHPSRHTFVHLIKTRQFHVLLHKCYLQLLSYKYYISSSSNNQHSTKKPKSKSIGKNILCLLLLFSLTLLFLSFLWHVDLFDIGYVAVAELLHNSNDVSNSFTLNNNNNNIDSNLIDNDINSFSKDKCILTEWTQRNSLSFTQTLIWPRFPKCGGSIIMDILFSLNNKKTTRVWNWQRSGIHDNFDHNMVEELWQYDNIMNHQHWKKRMFNVLNNISINVNYSTTIELIKNGEKELEQFGNENSQFREKLKQILVISMTHKKQENGDDNYFKKNHILISHFHFIDNISLITSHINQKYYSIHGKNINNEAIPEELNSDWMYDLMKHQLIVENQLFVQFGPRQSQLQWMTFLRNPMDRFVSLWNYLRGLSGGWRSQDIGIEARTNVWKATKNASLIDCIKDLRSIKDKDKDNGGKMEQERLDFCRLPNNYMTIWFCGQRPILQHPSEFDVKHFGVRGKSGSESEIEAKSVCDPYNITQATYLKAKYNFDHYFGFIGLLEYYDISIEIFYDKFNHLLDNKKVKNKNDFINRFKQMNDNLEKRYEYKKSKTNKRHTLSKTDENYKWLEQYNKYDVKLYNYIKHKFETCFL